MDMNKEKWVKEVMNSLDDVRSAEATPFLYTRILSKIDSKKTEYSPMKLVWLAAASFALLIFLNVTILRSVRSKSSSTEAQTLASGYNLLNENSINYNQ
jgi:hypothetical protein